MINYKNPIALSLALCLLKIFPRYQFVSLDALLCLSLIHSFPLLLKGPGWAILKVRACLLKSINIIIGDLVMDIFHAHLFHVESSPDFYQVLHICTLFC